MTKMVFVAADSDSRFPRRLNLRLSEETYAAYEELALLDGRGVSAIVREVLDTAAPEISMMADALRAAIGSVPTEGTDLYRKYMQSVHARAGAEVARADLWHREAEDVMKAREEAASAP
jgi:predicted DNA-binding protein